jgi:DNA mismatch endonuclease, patch repair protein
MSKRGAHGVTRPTFRVKPDFVFRQVRLALFVDGCFWHGCPRHCKYAKWLTPSVMANNPPSPKGKLRRTGRAFWKKKLAGNKIRDRLVTRTLRHAGWHVIRIWECELPKQNSGVRIQKPEWNKILKQIRRIRLQLK